jgi:hypothetical protein
VSFKQEFLTALQSGKDHQVLLEIVRRHYGGKETNREAYDALEELWRELGFQESDEESPLRDELEYVMERVWYYGANVG